jgi:hypothetical protein
VSNFGQEGSRKETSWEDNIRWEVIIKMYLREVGYLNWIHLAQGREVIVMLFMKSVIMKCYHM